MQWIRKQPTAHIYGIMLIRTRWYCHIAKTCMQKIISKMPLLAAGSTLAQTYNGTTVLERGRNAICWWYMEGVCSKDVTPLCMRQNLPGLPPFLHTVYDGISQGQCISRQNSWSLPHVMPTLYITRVRKFAIILKQALICSLGVIPEMLLCLQQYVKTKGISIKHLIPISNVVKKKKHSELSHHHSEYNLQCHTQCIE